MFHTYCGSGNDIAANAMIVITAAAFSSTIILVGDQFVIVVGVGIILALICCGALP